MANEDVPEMYRGSQKQIDGYRWVRELTRDIDSPNYTVPAIPHPSRQADYRPLPAIMTIYFVQSAAGPIKIGRARRLAFRLKDLQMSSPVKLEVAATVEAPPEREKEYHRQFAEHRLHGEWFSPAPEILAEIARLQEQPS